MAVLLQCVSGVAKEFNGDPCPTGSGMRTFEGVALTTAEYNSIKASTQPADPVLMAQVFFFFFTSSIALWVVGKVIGTVIKFTRDA